MTIALMLFLATAVVPVFFGKIRSAPIWLTAQAVALALAGFARHGELTLHSTVAMAEILVLRAVVAPLLLRRATVRREEANFDLMPSNLLIWMTAIALVVLAFEFGAPDRADHALALGVVAATVAVALLLLATNPSPPAQLVAVLFMENALALFETMLPQPWPLPVHASLSAIYLLAAGVASWLIGVPDPTEGSGGIGVVEDGATKKARA
jgi:hydrogenase-4 membrane subunit HyfE